MLGHIFWNALIEVSGPASTNMDGSTWSVDLTARCLAGRSLLEMSDYPAGLRSAGRLDVLSPEQREMALCVLKRWREGRGTPTPLELIVEHERFEDPLRAWHEMPAGYFDEERADAPNQYPIRFRPPLLVALRPESEPELEVALRTLAATRTLFIEAGGSDRVDLAAVAKRV